MELKDIREQSVEHLRQELAVALAKLQEMRFSLAGAQKKDVREVRLVKRMIARINTVIKEKFVETK